MSQAEKKINIKLIVGQTPFDLRIPMEDEEVYRKAADEVNEILNDNRNRYAQQSDDVYMKMTMLVLAVKEQRLQKRKDIGPIKDSLQSLLDEIEPLIKK